MPSATLNTLLVVDVEATCDAAGRMPRRQMEIIEIGALKVSNAKVVDEFQTFVRPVRHPALTDFCTALTSITQQDVAEAPTFLAAIANLKRWMYSGARPEAFGSWGHYDQRQFVQDSEFHGIPYPMPSPHLNLKKSFSAVQGLSKKLGLGQALRHVGREFEGTAHRGIDESQRGPAPSLHSDLALKPGSAAAPHGEHSP